MGHKVQAMPTVAGGMNAIQFHDDGTMSGAACWRADGTPIGIAGGARTPRRAVRPRMRCRRTNARYRTLQPRAAIPTP
jgi:hypothetical protein